MNPMFSFIGNDKVVVDNSPMYGNASRNSKGVAIKQMPMNITKNWMISVYATAY